MILAVFYESKFMPFYVTLWKTYIPVANLVSAFVVCYKMLIAKGFVYSVFINSYYRRIYWYLSIVVGQYVKDVVGCFTHQP